MGEGASDVIGGVELGKVVFELGRVSEVFIIMRPSL